MCFRWPFSAVFIRQIGEKNRCFQTNKQMGPNTHKDVEYRNFKGIRDIGVHLWAKSELISSDFHSTNSDTFGHLQKVNYDFPKKKLPLNLNAKRVLYI